MTRDRRRYPLSESTRELRRLGHSASVTTTYANHQQSMETVVTNSTAAEREGYEEGYARGVAAGQDEIEQLRRRLNEQLCGSAALLDRAAQELGDFRRALNDEFECHVPELAMALVAEILGHELRVSDNPGRDALHRALSSGDDVQTATVRMNPIDLENLSDVSDVTKSRSITFVADATIESGGVLVETGDMTLDVRISTALERIRKVLTGAVSAGGGG